MQEFKKQLKELDVPLNVRAQKCGCLDVCEKGPMVAVYPDGVFYGGVTPEDVSRIIDSHIVNGKVLKDLQVTEK